MLVGRTTFGALLVRQLHRLRLRSGCPGGRDGLLVVRRWRLRPKSATRATASRLTLALLFAGSSVLAASPAVAQARGEYVALGDSVAAPPDSYVDRLFDVLRTPQAGGIDTLHKRAQAGASSGSLRTGGQLAAAVADIDAPSDTKVVTIDIGGNDRGACGGTTPSWHLSSCAFAANFDATLADLQAALVRDSGSEALVAMTYYNPASGTATPLEQEYDRGLLGSDLRLDCAPSGDPRLGLNDRIACIASARGALVADVYPTFRRAGQTLIGDGLHPNGAGQAAIAAEFRKTLAMAPLERDRVPPVITAFAVVPRSFLATRRGRSIDATGNARVSYRLSEASVTTFRVERAVRGRRVGKKCVAPTRGNRRARLCRRRVRMRGFFTHAGHRGDNSFKFTGRLARRQLPPGEYRLVARAKDIAGNESRAVRARFALREGPPDS